MRMPEGEERQKKRENRKDVGNEEYERPVEHGRKR